VGDKAVKGIDREPTELLRKAADTVAASVREESTALQEAADRVTLLGTLFMAITLVVGGIIFFVGIRRYVVGPTAIVMNELEHLAAGDFSRPVTRHGHDEIGRLADSAEQIRVHLGKTLAEVVQSAQRLAEAAERLATVANVTSDGVAAQQREVEQVATAINEMSSTINEVARSAASAAEAAGNADRESRSGRQTVSGTIDDIDKLASEIEATAKAVGNLETHSRNISSVIDVIRGIAEQTNLLALNAAIEAARAGEQGRGFAVVADEVRTLASRTQKSTQEIQELISQLQNGTHATVDVMGRSRALAGETVTQAAGARQALDSITGAIGRINDMNAQIASASEEQGTVAEELNRNIVRINQVAEESAAGSQQIASASRELNTLAKQLESLTGRFKL
jgi:methyl-accepting chemotaxis protein